MKCPSTIATETERLKALSGYGLGNEHPLPCLDPVVQIASRMFGMPVAAINMIGNDHVFFAASTGVGKVDMRRDVSFCAHAILQEGGMVVPDARLDERFHDNPLVTGPSNLRFYAGVPIRSPEGHALGALCVIDGIPHPEFSGEDHERLRELARMAADRLELRRIECFSDRAIAPLGDIIADTTTPVIHFDQDRTLTAWNEAAATLLGYGVSDGIGQSLDLLLLERERAGCRDFIARVVAAGSIDGVALPAEVGGLHRNGTELRINPLLFCEKRKGRISFSAILRDVTSRRREEEELHRLANFDVLTGLANRGHFYRRVEDMIVSRRPAAIVMIDLDGFKDINDTLGHAVGDSVLREVATRLAGPLGPDDVVARIGGDEFAVLLPNRQDCGQAADLAQGLIEDVANPIAIDGHEVCVAASCGVALTPAHAQEALELIENADLALFKAKATGRGRSLLFSPAFRMEAAARRLYAMELHRAANDSEFLLFYQPQVRLADGALAGAEALIRWRHPVRGLLSPAAFLPALEGGPLAATVGAWVLDEACAQAALWRRCGASSFRIGVNLFGAQFRVGDLAADIAEALRRHGLPPEALELEVTENIALEHDELALKALERLRALGVGVAFDDFGTGYASLSLLKCSPLTRIKIDRSFVQGMLKSRRDASVVHAILDMAQNLDLETIAEGIETVQERDHLRDTCCGEGQGYLFGKPMPPAEFARAFGIATTCQAATG